jgi:anthranilate phosphoribosyltransferase
MGQHATVVHTPAPAGPCDEVTSLAPFTVTLASESPSQSEPLVREQDLDPRPAHAPAAEPSQGHPLAPLAGRDAPFNARAIVECFNARPSPFADSVVLTAALALATLRQELDKPWPSDELRAAITDGRAAGLLRTIRSLAPALREQSAQQIQPA